MAADLTVSLSGTPVPIYLGENATLAAIAAAAAESSAHIAEAARDVAVATSTTYNSLALAEAGSVNGDFFTYKDAGGYPVYAKKVGGVVSTIAAPWFEGDKVGFVQAGTGAVATTAETELRKRVTYGQHSTLQQSINLAASGRSVDLGGQTVTLGSEPANQYGTRLTNGKVLVPSGISTYTTQLNSYAPDANGLVVGREHLAPWWKSVTAGTLQTIHLYGDSTAQYGGDLDPVTLGPDQLIQLALYQAGVNNCLVANHGLSGTSWSDLNAIPNLGATTKLLIIKYGINDADKTDPLATIAANMRAKLTAIRAATNGSAYDLAILLMGPNSTFRPQYGQDAKWYEDLRNIYVQICREFHCAYFDTYAYLQDTRIAPGSWMDSFDGGQGLHPDAVAVYWIWVEGLLHHVFGQGEWNIQKSNQNWNVNYSTFQQPAAALPQSFPYGDSKWGALTVVGWPANGFLKVTRHADGIVLQELLTLDVVPRRMVRTGSAGVWTQWTVVQTAISTFLNSWVNAAGGFKPAGYMATTNGTVKLFGGIKDGTNAASAFTLPANVRPAFAHRFDVTGGNIVVFADGNVIPTVSATTHVTLDGIEFPVL